MRDKASFIKPMLLLRADALPSDAGQWEYQLKLDGYRAVAFKGGKVHLRSRNDNDCGARYGQVLHGLAGMPPETVIDGEVVALDETGRPSFNLLQNYASGAAPLVFFVFDVMMLRGRDLSGHPLVTRRELLEQKILPTLRDPVRYAAPLDAPLSSFDSRGQDTRLRGTRREAARQSSDSSNSSNGPATTICGMRAS